MSIYLYKEEISTPRDEAFATVPGEGLKKREEFAADTVNLPAPAENSP